ncbi:MAG: hypothetical protein U9Q98_12500 [Bacteroidota bacterium]|nr:hypothetical protein [Bacteroidota bacterium]
MLRRVIFSIFAFVLTIFLFSGCAKVEDHLGGTWKLETMTAEEPYEVIWYFRSDQSLVRVCNQFNDTSENATQVDTAYYTIEDKLTFTAIKIIESQNSSCLAYVNGFFRVEKITENLLVITRYKMQDETTGGAYLRREFTRVD